VLLPIAQQDAPMKKIEMSLLKSKIDFRICLKWLVEFVLCVNKNVCLCCLLALSHSALTCGLDEADEYEGVLGNARLLA